MSTHLKNVSLDNRFEHVIKVFFHIQKKQEFLLLQIVYNRIHKIVFMDKKNRFFYMESRLVEWSRVFSPPLSKIYVHFSSPQLGFYLKLSKS